MNKIKLTMFKIFAVVFALLCPFSVFFGCGGGGGGAGSNKIVLTVWEDESNIPMLEPLATQFVNDYRKAYPNAPLLEIKFEHQAEGSAIENLGLYGPVGTAADITAFIHDTVGTGANSGDLSRVLYDDALKAEMTDEAVRAFTIDGNMYGYPITPESITLIYDKSKVTKEKLASFESIKQNNLKIAMKVTGEGSAYYGFSLLSDSVLFGQDGSDKNTINLATTQSVENLTEFYSKYSSSNIADVMPDEALSLLTSGEVQAIMSTPYMWASAKNALGNNAAVTVLPTLNGQTLRPFAGYKGYGVSSHSKHPHLAHALAKYLVSADAQKMRFIQKQYLPTLKNTAELDALVANDKTNKYEFVPVFNESIQNALTMPAILAMGNYWQPMQDAHSAMKQKGAQIDASFVTSQLTSAVTSIKK